MSFRHPSYQHLYLPRLNSNDISSMKASLKVPVGKATPPSSHAIGRLPLPWWWCCISPFALISPKLWHAESVCALVYVHTLFDRVLST